MQIRHRDTAPSVDPAAYIAPTAVLSGDVRVGPGSCVLHGAVLTADGGPVRVGAAWCRPGEASGVGVTRQGYGPAPPATWQTRVVPGLAGLALPVAVEQPAR